MGSVFEDIVQEVATSLTEIGTQNVQAAFRGLGIKDPGVINQAITEITTYAKQRAAQMVGYQWVADALVSDPAAEMAITSLTRRGIGESVANVLEAFESGEIDSITTAAMSEQLMAHYAFSTERSGLIAQFESRHIANKGYLAAWKASGKINRKFNRLSPEHIGPDDCDSIEALGVVDIDANFNGFGFGPPWHVRCQCSVWACGHRRSGHRRGLPRRSGSRRKGHNITSKGAGYFRIGKGRVKFCVSVRSQTTASVLA